MAHTQSAQSPLTRLVRFMFCLAGAVTGVAGVYYVTVDLPAQRAAQAPSNSWCSEQCQNTYFGCMSVKDGKIASVCEAGRDTCLKGCEGKTYSGIQPGI